MKTFKELLIDLGACEDAREWAEDKTIEQSVEDCHRGDWLLWLAKKVEIDLQPLTLAKGHCANTVRHLMNDERSVKAVDAAIAFGEGKATIEDLRSAADVAYAIAFDAANSAAYAAAAASASAANSAADATAAYAADATAASAYSANDDYVADAYAAGKQNKLETSDICRKYIGELIIKKGNELLKAKEDVEQ